MIIENLKRVMEDYVPDESIWNEDDDRVLNLKRAMNVLEESDRIIFTLYCEYGSLRKVGKRLGVSHSIIYKNIRRIKLQMLDWLKENCSDGQLVADFEKTLGGDDDDNMD